ncbi:hypothetical protein [Ochrovirga pacifica]|uniref:hypothetical protein n=1 Tax=Ochrovirga pacifica TaxID=1042376 RepID=UPI000255A273|nr:hypothetical protein [Ochrovirga pacifica]
MRKFILIAVLVLVGVTTYGQNYNYPVGLYSYESLTGIETSVRDSISSTTYSKSQNTASTSRRSQNYNYPVGLYNYNSISSVKLKNFDADYVKGAKSKKELLAEDVKRKNEKSRKNIVIRKAKDEVLVRYNGDYSSIKLLDFSGKEVKANFSKKYRGLIVPRDKQEKKCFLEVVKNEANVYYHLVSL